MAAQSGGVIVNIGNLEGLERVIAYVLKTRKRVPRRELFWGWDKRSGLNVIFPRNVGLSE